MALCDRAAGLHVHVNHSVPHRVRGKLHLQGRADPGRAARHGDAAALGARADDPDVAAAGPAGRVRPAVRRPRVRRDAGVRRQPDAADAACRPSVGARAGPRRPTSCSWRCRTPTSASARSRSASWPRARKARCARASSSRTSRTSCSTSARSRRRAAAGRDVFMADNRPGQPPAIYLARQGRVVIDREQRTVEMVLEDGARHTADAGGQVRGLPVRATAAPAESGHRLSARGSSARRARDVDSAAPGARGGARARGHLSAQRAVRDPEEVLDSVCLPGVRADRPGARRQQPPRRQAGELRHRHRRHLRLLRAALARAVARARAHRSARGWRRGCPTSCSAALGVLLFLLARPRRPIGRCGFRALASAIPALPDSAAQAADARDPRPLRRVDLRARRGPVGGGDGGHLLHLHVPGSVGQSVPRPGDVEHALGVFLVRRRRSTSTTSCRCRCCWPRSSRSACSPRTASSS